jgi:Prolipoprotein diacylglyceryl transferase
VGVTAPSRDDAVTAGRETARVLTLLELIPRTAVGRHGRSPYAVAATTGAAAGTLTALALGATAGLPALTGLAVAAAALTGAACASGLRHLLTARPDQVAQEQLAAALALVTAVLALTGEPVLAGLEVAAAGLAVAQSIGRIGCAAAGCCYGRPARAGLVYLPAHATGGVPTVPVALFEAAGLALVAVAVAGATVTGPPGAGLVVYLLLAGGIRALAEGWRGDPRPSLGGVSVPRLVATAESVAGAVLAAMVLPRPDRPPVLAGIALAGALVGAVAGRLALGGSRPGRRTIREATAAIRRLMPVAAQEPQVAQVHDGLALIVSRERDHVHVSFSRGGAPAAELAECAARSLGRLRVVDARLSPAGILHVSAVPAGDRPRALGHRRLELDLALARPVRNADPDYFTAGA